MTTQENLFIFGEIVDDTNFVAQMKLNSLVRDSAYGCVF